jgi:hypothetical protein
VGEYAAAPPEEAARPRLWARIRARRSRWALLVGASSAALVAAGVSMASLWLVSSGTRTTSFGFAGPLLGVEIEVARGDVEILGGGRSDVNVRRADSFAYGREPREQLALEGGVLRIASRCDDLVVGACSSAYTVAVPDNVPVTVRVAHGDVRLAAYRGSARLTTGGGSIAVDAFCGFVLEATAKQGDVDVATACSPERLDLRSDSGDVRAVVPRARYRIDADSSGGRVDVRGVEAADDAPWEIRALSGSGDVTVAAGS